MKKLLLVTNLLLYCFVLSQQYQMPVTSVTTKNPIENFAGINYNASLMIDENLTSHYVSKKGYTTDLVDFTFNSSVQSIDKIVYSPRQSLDLGRWKTVQILYSTYQNPEVFIEAKSDLTWLNNNGDKIVTLDSAIKNPHTIRFVVSETYGNYSSAAEVRFFSKEEQSFAMPVSSINTSNPFEFYNNLTYAASLMVDNDNNSHYVSKKGYTTDKVEVKFENSVKSINKIVYTPRQSLSLGRWKKLNISYSTNSDPDTFITLKENLIWSNNNTDKITELDQPIVNPHAIKFDVLETYGDYSSAAELRFFSKDDLTYQMQPVSAVTTTPTDREKTPPHKTIDNDNSTYYASNNGNTTDVLDFFFKKNVKSINKIYYTPRSGNNVGKWKTVNVLYSTYANPKTFVVAKSGLEWSDSGQEEVVSLFKSIQNPFIIRFEVTATHGNVSSAAEVRFFSNEETSIIVDNSCVIPLSEFTSNNNDTFSQDLKILPSITGSWTSESQADQGIDKSIDGDLSTRFHSRSDGGTVLPVVLNYNFTGDKDIDYLVYYPDNNINGSIGEGYIEYNTLSNPNYVRLMDFNFGQKSTKTTLEFLNRIKPLNIKITVKSGKGNLVNVAEMEFYHKAITPTQWLYNNIFADNIYSTLKSGVTQKEIDAIESVFYKSLAQCLFNNTYDKKSRVKTYEVYKTRETVNKELKINGRSLYENPTGIVIEAGEKVALFAKNIPDNTLVYLRVSDIEKSFNGTEKSFFQIKLHNGMNIFEAPTNLIFRKGLGHVEYFNDDMTLPNIQLNIVSGKINGVFDANSTDLDYFNLANNDAYSFIEMSGKYIHYMAHKFAIKQVGYSGSKLLSTIDTIGRDEGMLQGFYKYPERMIKNRLFAITSLANSTAAGSNGTKYSIGSDGSKANRVLDTADLSIWGFAHEFGHNNQIRPFFNFNGIAETTNNIYSIWSVQNINNSTGFTKGIDNRANAPIAGMKSLSGGRTNTAILQKVVNKEPYLTPEYNNDTNLIPFNQLLLYYSMGGAAKGAPVLTFENKLNTTHTDGVDYANWHAILQETFRRLPNTPLTLGENVLNIAKLISDAVQEDLTDFFINTGFLRPVDIKINGYDKVDNKLTITQQQVDATIAEIKNKGYKKPVSPVLHYLSGNSLYMYKDGLLLDGTTGIGVEKTGNYLKVKHSDWKNAVAYETLDANDNLIFVTISGTGDVNDLTTTVYYPNNAAKVFAVGFDGERKLVYPAPASAIRKTLASLEAMDLDENNFNIYPNPARSNSSIIITIKDTTGLYNLSVNDASGKLVLSGKGNINQLNNIVNSKMKNFSTGTYIFTINNENSKFTKKVVIQ